MIELDYDGILRLFHATILLAERDAQLDKKEYKTERAQLINKWRADDARFFLRDIDELGEQLGRRDARYRSTHLQHI